MREQLNNPSIIILLGILLTVLVAIESLYIVPWAPFFPVYAALAIIIPLYAKNYTTGSIASLTSKRNILSFALGFIIVSVTLYCLEALYTLILSAKKSPTLCSL
ncbi:MAG: hypothetical protein ACTSX9_08560 [Candidatus Njordarchaeales archaeon]